MKIEVPAVGALLVTVLLGLGTIALAALKGFSIIDVPWWVVAAPIGVPVAIALIALGVMYPLAWIVESRHKRRKARQQA